MVSVRTLVPPAEMVLGTKLLMSPGRPPSTFKVALAVPLLPALDVKSPEVLS